MYVIARFCFKESKLLLIKDDKAAGLKEMPLKGLSEQYCCPRQQQLLVVFIVFSSGVYCMRYVKHVVFKHCDWFKRKVEF